MKEQTERQEMNLADKVRYLNGCRATTPPGCIARLFGAKETYFPDSAPFLEVLGFEILGRGEGETYRVLAPEWWYMKEVGEVRSDVEQKRCRGKYINDCVQINNYHYPEPEERNENEVSFLDIYEISPMHVFRVDYKENGDNKEIKFPNTLKGFKQLRKFLAKHESYFRWHRERFDKDIYRNNNKKELK